MNLSEIDAIKIDLAENVNVSYSKKVTDDFLASNIDDLSLEKVARLTTAYLTRFGDIGIKALHLAILCGRSQDVMHDIFGGGEFFEPRTLSLWGDD